jgi:site-specific recombinase XerD
MAADERKVGRHHLAFYRGWVQGMDLAVVASKYLEIGLDLRLARSTHAWLRDTLSQAALRQGRRGEARLLRMSLRHVLQSQDGNQPAASTNPTLEQFREEHDPDDFYSEDELIAIYAQAFPQVVDRRASRRHRLIERQLAALRWVEELIATKPVPGDWVTAWFDKTVADRFLIARIYTLEDLQERIQAKGFRWWADVPRMGAKGAARIIAWLQGYEDSLGKVPLQALKPQRKQNALQLIAQRPQTMAIVPMEVLAVPHALSGMQGSNRNHSVQRIKAQTDLEAIAEWIYSKAGSPNTARAYRKEAERLLLWAVMERGKALADLDVDDCAKYRDWLSMLGRTEVDQWPFTLPQARWIGRRNIPRTDEAWRPFDGKLSLPSVRQAIVIVSSFFEWLVKVQYFGFNPWTAVNTKPASRKGDKPPDLELTRVLSESQWDFLLAHVESTPPSAARDRARFALTFAYSTGMRLSELVDSTVEMLYSRPLRGQLGQRWMLNVLGKGGKWRAVPMSDGVMESLSAYLASRNLFSNPMDNPPSTPLIASLNGKSPVTGSMLYKALREVFMSAAQAMRLAGHTHEAGQIERASTHWLRHSRGSHLGLAGVAPSVIQQLLGHASLATTSIYTQHDDERLWKELSEHDRPSADEEPG